MYPGQGPNISNTPQIAQSMAPRHVGEQLVDDAVVGFAAYFVIRAAQKRWYSPGVRAASTSFLLLPTWFVTCIGACIISALVKPGDQADLGPILLWTLAASAVVTALLMARTALRGVLRH